MSQKRVCRDCQTFGDCEIAKDGKPKCPNCINKPITVVDQETCEHTIKWGVVSGTCTKCRKYFEMDNEMQIAMGVDFS